MATSKASPNPASQAENAKSSIGVVVKAVALVCKDQIARRRNKDNINPSRHKRAERR